MNYLTCSHLTNKEVEMAITIHSKLVQFNRFPYGKVHVCLICSRSDVRLYQVNAETHFKETQHSLFMKVSQPCELLCKLCGDYQFCSLFDNRTGRKREAIKDTLLDRNPKFAKIEPALDSSLISAVPTFPNISNVSVSRGLVNMGATCFMNSVLQVLVHHNQFADSVHLRQHLVCCPIGNKKLLDGSTCIPCEFGGVAHELRQGEESEGPVVPSSLLYSIWNLINYMVGYAQQDAHEFLLAFFTGLESQLPVENVIFDGTRFEKLYSGSFQSTLTCLNCKDRSVITENFVDLSLSLESNSFNPDVVTLMDCLELFTVEETLEPMMCDKCGKKEQKSKQLRIVESPDLLILHLKRFDFLKNRKITKQVIFPDLLNIKRFCVQTEESLQYSLLGVVSHEGTLNQGHYISYVKDCDEWKKYDDENITFVTAEEVHNASAYLLFYVRG